jgi:hypothetical protein
MSFAIEVLSGFTPNEAWATAITVGFPFSASGLRGIRAADPLPSNLLPKTDCTPLIKTKEVEDILADVENAYSPSTIDWAPIWRGLNR